MKHQIIIVAPASRLSEEIARLADRFGARPFTTAMDSRYVPPGDDDGFRL
jgi:hypothetical protein